MGTTPEVPTPANPASRKLTEGEITKLVSDAWQKLNMRLAPGRLNTSCFFRVDNYMIKHFPEVKDAVLQMVWSDYAGAVKALADGYFRSATAEELFYGDALEWVVPHPAIAKRKQRELEQRGLSRQPEAQDPAEFTRKNDDFAAKTQAEKDHENAVRRIEVAIGGVVFQNFKGIDQRKIDETRASLREYVSKNLGKANGVKVLENVKQLIFEA